MSSKPVYFVSGASGQLGRRVIELLLEANLGTIIAGTRSPKQLEGFAKQGVIVRYANFDEADSLIAAFEGANRLLLISTDSLGEGEKRLNQHRNAVTAAEDAGISHVVYTSITAADNSPVLFAPDHAGTEKALAESKLTWTILRANLYMELLAPSLSQAAAIGGVYRATGEGKTAYISREDLALAAAAALDSEFDGRRILDISGSVALSQAEIVALANATTGSDLKFIPIDVASLTQAMIDAGLPRSLAEIYASIDVAIAEGKFATLTPDFEALTGKKARTVKTYLEAQKDFLRQAMSS